MFFKKICIQTCSLQQPVEKLRVSEAKKKEATEFMQLTR